MKTVKCVYHIDPIKNRINSRVFLNKKKKKKTLNANWSSLDNSKKLKRHHKLTLKHRQTNIMFKKSEINHRIAFKSKLNSSNEKKNLRIKKKTISFVKA
jgi:hypothetical protein